HLENVTVACHFRATECKTYASEITERRPGSAPNRNRCHFVMASTARRRTFAESVDLLLAAQRTGRCGSNRRDAITPTRRRRRLVQARSGRAAAAACCVSGSRG